MVSVMIDWDRVAELRRDFGEDDFAEIATMFLSEVQAKLAAMQAQLTDDLAEDFHFVKGSAANLGFELLYKECSSAELRSQSDSVQTLVTVFEASKTEFLNKTGIELAA